MRISFANANIDYRKLLWKFSQAAEKGPKDTMVFQEMWKMWWLVKPSSEKAKHRDTELENLDCEMFH